MKKDSEIKGLHDKAFPDQTVLEVFYEMMNDRRKGKEFTKHIVEADPDATLQTMIVIQINVLMKDLHKMVAEKEMSCMIVSAIEARKAVEKAMTADKAT